MLQSIVFPKSSFTTSSAYAWLNRHHIQPMLGKQPDIEAHTIRFRIESPKKFIHYYSKKLPNDIVLVYGK